MYLLDKTFPTPEQNTACDEALLDLFEEGFEGELLRFWESPDPFIVLGYSNHAAEEVHLDACRKASIPILRRCSGGGTVLQGPGCLNYAVILDTHTREGIQSVTQANDTVMQTLRQALQSLTRDKLEVKGHTDLTLRNIKFSGNAQRRRKRFILFHGTLLYDFDLSRIGKFLKFPSRQPDYRDDRDHQSFVFNFAAEASELRSRLCSVWDANLIFEQDPGPRVSRLIESKYALKSWNLR